ncbi:MAG TPA: sterol carrier family protein [Acidothermaceae bacterium]
MHPAARTTDVATVTIAQWRSIAAAVELLPDDEFDRPSTLPGWQVADLVAHLAMCAGAPARWLAEPTPAKAEVNAAAYFLCLQDAADDVDARTRERARDKTPMQLRADVRAAVDELVAVVATTDPARVIPTRLAPMRFDEFLITRCVEGVVHGLDLDPPVSPDSPALKLVTKALLAALVVKAPGHTVEMRVPPFAAVQCVEGPRHTRGTPSNVVETDAVTWVRLATGRLGWSDAIGDGRLRASGERSDISGLLPLL